MALTKLLAKFSTVCAVCLFLAGLLLGCDKTISDSSQPISCNIEKVIHIAFAMDSPAYDELESIIAKTNLSNAEEMRAEERLIFSELYGDYMSSSGIESLYVRWRVDWVLNVFLQLDLETAVSDILIADEADGQVPFSFTFIFATPDDTKVELLLHGSVQLNEAGMITFFTLTNESEQDLVAETNKLFIFLVENPNFIT